ncbi:hypothetical protein L6452_23357 [Arctium lappa]|uniref:Uncharacterized protein n=1 Tax=Arctium lappa TaxID=4217 RepID=A0ACB9B3L0_ARCLA|nr:hypothetical protein L6452_23357 [Arctium lappa]
MNRRIRTQSTTTKNSDDGYLRYLKPGALAKLRDSKINARSHHRSSGSSQIYIHLTLLSPSPTSSPSRSPTPTVAAGLPQHQQAGGATVTDGGLPYFSKSFYGPRFPQRKKLMAAKSMLSMNVIANGTTADNSQSVIDVFGSDFIVAH